MKKDLLLPTADGILRITEESIICMNPNPDGTTTLIVALNMINVTC